MATIRPEFVSSWLRALIAFKTNNELAIFFREKIQVHTFRHVIVFL
jgi:hypothetical protein